jgi:hypothetical protein
MEQPRVRIVTEVDPVHLERERDDEIARLRAKVGELIMDNELPLQRCQADLPFVPRRPRR